MVEFSPARSTGSPSGSNRRAQQQEKKQAEQQVLEQQAAVIDGRVEQVDDNVPFIIGCKGLQGTRKKTFLKSEFDADAFPENILLCPAEAR